MQWWVFRETRDTPRTIVAGHGKHDFPDYYGDDMIMEVRADFDGCKSRNASYSHYPKGCENTDPAKWPKIVWLHRGCDDQAAGADAGE